MKKVLVVRGGWDGHEPQQCSDIFIPWLKEQGFAVEVSETLDSYLDAKLMQEVALIIPVWTMGEISGEQSEALRKAVRGGAGLAGWHGGMCDAFRGDTEYQFMTGGQWVVHPGNAEATYTVNIKQSADGFMEGIKDFTVHSEQYYMHVDPGNEVLATTVITGEYGDVPWVAGTVMPVVWKRRYGQGRVFFSSLGHVAADFKAVPEMVEIMKRGMLWAVK